MVSTAGPSRLRVAFVIYIELNPANTWRFSAVAKLKVLLEKARLIFLWVPYTEALLLVVLLGGVGSIGHPERAWYVETLRMLVQQLGLEDFTETILDFGIAESLVGDTAELMERLWAESLSELLRGSTCSLPFPDVRKYRRAGGFILCLLASSIVSKIDQRSAVNGYVSKPYCSSGGASAANRK